MSQNPAGSPGFVDSPRPVKTLEGHPAPVAPSSDANPEIPDTILVCHQSAGRKRRRKRRRGNQTAVGAMLGNYQIVRRVAMGGMGTVYEGKHRYMGRRVAIKFQRPEIRRHRAHRRRFLGEAISTDMIDHPGIVRVFDYGYDDRGVAYMIMEYLDGDSLAARLRRPSSLTIYSAIDIARQIAQVMAASHHAGIVHRDLKPDNIYLVPDKHADDSSDSRGDRYHVKLFDFGVAKFASNEFISSMQTNLGDMLGTPAYMSPEQCLDSATVDHRSDIYALGCVLYEMVCGKAPFCGNIGQVLSGHSFETPAAPRSINPLLPEPLSALISQMLAKQPSQRPQSMQSVIAALTEISRSLPQTPSETAITVYPDVEISSCQSSSTALSIYATLSHYTGRTNHRLLTFIAALAAFLV